MPDPSSVNFSSCATAVDSAAPQHPQGFCSVTSAPKNNEVAALIGDHSQLGFTFGDLTSDTVLSSYSVDDVHQATMDILKDFGLKSAKEFAACAVGVYPHLSFSSLVLANTFHVYLWLLDDQFDNPKVPAELSQQLMTESVNGLKDPQTVTHPICKLGLYLLKQFKHPLLRTFLTQELALYYEGVREHLMWENSSKVCTTDYTHRLISSTCITTVVTTVTVSTVLKVDEFVRIRMKDGAVRAALPLAFQDVDDFTPYYRYFYSEAGKTSFELANKNICFVNDLHSNRSRDVVEQSTFNIVNSHMAEYQLTREESMKRIVEDCNRYYHELSTYHDDLGITKALLRWCEGSMRWHREAARYKETRTASAEVKI